MTQRIHRILVALSIASAGCTLALVAFFATTDSFTSNRWSLLLSLAGAAIGLGLAAVLVRYVHIYRRLVIIGLVGIGASQLAYNILVWSGLKTQATPWRTWWVFMVASLFSTHFALLLATRRAGRDRVNDCASWTAFAAAVAIAALALRSDLLGSLPWLWIAAIIVPATITVLCSAIVATRRLLEGGWIKKPPAAVPIALVASHLAVLLLGLYLGSLNSGLDPSRPVLPSPLAHLEDPQIEEQLDADFETLRAVIEGLDDLGPKMHRDLGGIRQRMLRERRAVLLPDEDEEIRWYMVTFLSCRTALLRLVATHAGFEALADPGRRAQSFLLGYTAAMAVYRSGLGFVRAYRDQPLMRRKLNEAEPAWGLPAGMFDRIYEDVSVERHEELCEEMAAYFELHKSRWRRDEVWGEKRFDWLDSEINNSLTMMRHDNLDRHRRWFDLVVEKVRRDAYTPVYAVQSMVADLIGDIRVIDRPRFIDRQIIDEIRPLMQPGDIILERRSWNASNAFLPGFWPHAALYVGNLDDLEGLGILDRPDIASRRDEFARPAADGAPKVIIEALGEGVIFNSLEHSLHADYAAVLRPRLSEEQITEVIVRAFRHQGKPYDFEFDFFTSDKLVCTELIFRAFQGFLDFDLVHIMGRDTLPALELVHKFERERNTDAQQLDLVFFLDADTARQTVFFADEEAFIESASRRREFNE